MRDNIQNRVSEHSPVKFLEHLRNKLNPDVNAFLDELRSLSKVLLFSGVIRDYYLGYHGPIRDLDLVVDCDRISMDRYLGNYDCNRNSFGGYKLSIHGLTVDLWHIDSTWAFSNSRVSPELFDEYNLPNTAFFNFSSVVFDFSRSEFITTPYFERFLSRRELDMVLEDNPLPQLCIVNTIYYTQKFNLKISKSLKNYFVNNFDRYSEEDFGTIQLKHFKKIKYPYDILTYYRNTFKDELRC